MNFKTTLVLIALLAVVGLYLKFFALKHDAVDPDAPFTSDQPKPLFTAEQLPVDEIEGMSITLAGKAMAFERTRDGWVQSKPVRYPLNKQAARDVILAAANKLMVTQAFMPGQGNTGGDAGPDGEAMPSLADLKLDPPLAEMAWDDKQGKAQRIKLGRIAPGNRGYALVNDDKRVHVISNELHQVLLKQSVDDWRARDLPAPSIDQAVAITFSNASHSVRLAREAARAGEWKLTLTPKDNGKQDLGEVGRADSKVLERWLAALDAVKVLAFADDTSPDMQAMGLDAPTFQLLIELAGVPGKVERRSRVFRIGGPVDLSRQRFFASWSMEGEPSKLAFEVDARQLAPLQPSVDALRDPRITPFPAKSVRAFTMVRPKHRAIALLKSTDGWAFPSKQEQPDAAMAFQVDHLEAEALVAQVSGALAVAYLPGFEQKYAEVSSPFATITLGGVGGVSEVLRVFMLDVKNPSVPAHVANRVELSDGAFVVLRQGETTGYVVPRDRLARIALPAVSLRERRVLAMKPTELREITIKRPGGESFQFQNATALLPAAGDDQQAHWKLVGYPRFEAKAFATLMQQLLPLRAEQWLEESPRVAGIELTLQPKQGPARRMVIDPSTRAAQLLAVDGVAGSSDAKETERAFLVRAELIEALQAEYRNRTVLPVAASQIAKVTVVRGQDTLTIERSNKGDFTSRQVTRVNQDNAARLFDTLGGLRAERYLFARAAPPKRLTRIDVNTASGVTISIVVYDEQTRGGGQLCSATGSIGGRKLDVWFTIDGFAYESFTGKLVEQP